MPAALKDIKYLIQKCKKPKFYDLPRTAEGREGGSAGMGQPYPAKGKNCLSRWVSAVSRSVGHLGQGRTQGALHTVFMALVPPYPRHGSKPWVLLW